MGIKDARHKGRVSIRGRPKEMAKAEIMVMKQKERQEDKKRKQKERYESKKRRRIFFTLLDFVIVIAFGLAIYSVYISNYLNAILFLIIGSMPLVYFIVRRILKNNKKKKKKKKKRK